MSERISKSFFEHKASDLPPVAELVHADIGITLSKALEQLVARRIHALPIFDNGKYVGIVSLKEITAFVVGQFYARCGTANKDKQGRIDSLRSHTFVDEDYRVISENIQKEPVKNHIQIVPSLKPETPLKEVVQALFTAERVPLLDQSGKIVNIISQATILRFIAQNINSVGTIITESLQQLNCITKPVHTVTINTSAIVSFAIMVENGFSSLGFIDEETSLICGVVSFKDIRGAVLEGTDTLLKTCEDYVNNIRRNDEKNITKDIVPTVNCSAKDNLGKVIAKLVAVGIHRLFVREDGATDFTGIVSLSDVLKLFSS